MDADDARVTSRRPNGCQVPPGHTCFSWLSASPRGCGHTDFSWIGLKNEQKCDEISEDWEWVDRHGAHARHDSQR